MAIRIRINVIQGWHARENCSKLMLLCRDDAGGAGRKFEFPKGSKRGISANVTCEPSVLGLRLQMQFSTIGLLRKFFDTFLGK